MPQQTNLNVSPYYDDYSYSSQYYKVLFKPGVSVQVRELNTMQSMLQGQIESFGDNIFSNGTIVSGCNFQTFYNYPYAKLNDLDIFGGTINIGAYLNMGVMNATTGLRGIIINGETGFIANDPNLNTIYINYTNSGFDGVNYFSTFSEGDILTIFNPVYNGIENISINNGGVGFSNTNQIIAVSAIAVINTVGFTVGQYITNGRGANVQISSIDPNTRASSGQVILSIQPRNVDLANASLTANAWTFANSDTLTIVGSNSSAGQVSGIIGVGFRGQLVTTATGSIQTTLILSKGIGYTTVPYMTVVSSNNASGLSTLQLVAQNYITKVAVANVAQAVGSGYAFGVSRGVIFSEGFFLDVQPQTIVVDKYNTSPNYPNNVCVGFSVEEQIIDYTQDQSLLDPASTTNQNAPGADRLKLVPTLVLTNPTDAASNTAFFTIGQWNQGNFVKQNQQTVYSIIGDTMAQRTYEQTGDFVVDEFLLTTQSPTNTAFEGHFFNVVIDPGLAYLQGYRTPTYTNDILQDDKGLDTNVTNNYTISLAYGNYFIVDQVGGTWTFNQGETVYLYDTAKTFLSNTSLVKTANSAPVGNLIGTADIRSMTTLSGIPGSAGASYQMYVFNIQMANGCSISQVQSIYANASSNGGICDVIPSIISSGNTYGGQVFDSKKSTMLFPARVESLKNANNISYQYRTVNTTAKLSNAGIISVTAPSGDLFPYGPGADLDLDQLSFDLYVAPTEADAVFVANGSGTISVSTVTGNVIGTSTNFLSVFNVGDWIYVYNNVGYDLHNIINIVNNTFMVVESNATFINTASHYVQVFPKNVPIPLGQGNVTANVNGTGAVLTINLGTALNDTGDDGFGDRAVTVGFNILRSDVSSSSKTANRQRFVKIDVANNVGGTTGPWCLGVPDAFRLRGVYIGNSSVDTTGSNWISSFSINNNQNLDFYDLSALVMNSQAPYNFLGNEYILVEFDYFSVTSPGLYTTVSYVGSNANTIAAMDSLDLDDLTSNNGVNSMEIQSFFTSTGKEIPLMQAFDFRPYNANTVLPTTSTSTAPVNPPYAVNFGSNEKKFPLPNSLFTCDLEYYLGRIDIVTLDTHSNINIVQGIPATAGQRIAPIPPKNTMLLGSISVPAYPNISLNPSPSFAEIINTGVNNGQFSSGLIGRATVTVSINNGQLPYNQPQNYTMADIGTLDRRLQAVEYYVSLSQLESNVANMNIPSSVDPSANRFQFGYFVDDFSTQLFSALNDPQYAATKEVADIVPSKLLFDAYLQGTIGTVTYKDILLVSQLNATYAIPSSNVGPNTVIKPVCVGAFDNVVAYVTQYRSWTDNFTPGSNSAAANLVSDSLTLRFINVEQLEQLYSNTNTNFSALAFNGQGNAAFQTQLDTILSTIVAGPPTEVSFAHLGGNVIEEALASIASKAFAYQTKYSAPSSIPTLPSVNTSIWAMFPFLSALPVELFFYNYNNPTRIDIFQANTGVPMTSTSASVNGVAIPSANQPRALTQAEITTLTGPDSNYFFDDQPSLYLTAPTQASVTGGLTGYYTGAGAISFQYNSQQSEYYNVVASTFKGPNRRWKWAMGYPVGGASVGCIPDQETWNYLLLESGCTNNSYGAAGQWYPPGVQINFPFVYGGTGGLTFQQIQASVQPFDINSMWYGGQNAVAASGTPYTGQIYAVPGTFTYADIHQYSGNPVLNPTIANFFQGAGGWGNLVFGFTLNF